MRDTPSHHGGAVKTGRGASDRRHCRAGRATVASVNDPDRQARREARAQWAHGVAHSQAEMAVVDAAFWQAMTPEARISLAWTLSLEQGQMTHEGDAPGGLRGSPHGVRRR